MKLLLPVLAASVLVSVSLSGAKGELFYFWKGGSRNWMDNLNETKTNYVFQMMILGGGETLEGRKEMKFSIVSNLHLKGKHLLF